MALVKIEDFDRNFDDVADSNIINFSVYADRDSEKIGTVEDILVDENEGKLRYLIVDIGFWIFGKKVLLPIGLASISFSDKRVYAQGLTKEQAENLPEFNNDLKIDRNYEEQVRNTVVLKRKGYCKRQRSIVVMDKMPNRTNVIV